MNEIDFSKFDRETKRLFGIQEFVLNLRTREMIPIDEYEGKKAEDSLIEKIEIPKKQWFNLKEASEIKGIGYKQLCNKPYLKPNGGIHDGIVNGRKCWRLETIIKWLKQTDYELETLYKKRKAKT